MDVLAGITEFEWDQGNSTKSLTKHKVSVQEQEEACLDDKRFVIEDKRHSIVERRFLLFGSTRKKRKLIIAFTIRTIESIQKIRPVSARPMNRKEVILYEKTITMA